MSNFSDRVLEVVAPLLQGGDKRDVPADIVRKIDDILTCCKDVKQEEISLFNKIKPFILKKNEDDEEEKEKDRQRIRELLEDPVIKTNIQTLLGDPGAEMIRSLERKYMMGELREGIDDTREAVDDAVDKLLSVLNTALLASLVGKEIPEILQLPGSNTSTLAKLAPWVHYSPIQGQTPDDSKLGQFVKQMQECCADTNNNMGAYYILLHDEIASINPDPDAIRRIESRLEQIRGSLR